MYKSRNGFLQSARWLILFATLSSSAVPIASAIELSEIVHKFVDGHCKNLKDPSSSEVYKKGYFGECGDISIRLLYNTNSPKINLRGVYAYRTTFHNFAIEEAILLNADFKQAYLIRSNFNRVNAEQSDFHGARIFRSTLAGVNFEKADLRALKVRKSDFSNANFRNARMQASYFWASSFRSADLRGADLRLVNFVGCDLSGARFNSQTQLPFSKDEAFRIGMVAVEGAN